jgi:xanthine/uracil permease
VSASAAPLPKPLASEADHPVDEVLAAPRLIALGVQHVVVMFAGAVAVPLIVGAAVKGPREQVAFPITCDLLACGIASAWPTRSIRAVASSNARLEPASPP